MWPKLLFDLLPHFARLMPMADKYLASRSASDKAHENALVALAENVRCQVAEAHEGIYRQLGEQSAQIADLAVGSASEWGGAPDASTVFPASVLLQSVKVWQ